MKTPFGKMKTRNVIIAVVVITLLFVIIYLIVDNHRKDREFEPEPEPEPKPESSEETINIGPVLGFLATFAAVLFMITIVFGSGDDKKKKVT
jgi:hypothetical protein